MWSLLRKWGFSGEIFITRVSVFGSEKIWTCKTLLKFETLISSLTSYFMIFDGGIQQNKTTLETLKPECLCHLQTSIANGSSQNDFSNSCRRQNSPKTIHPIGKLRGKIGNDFKNDFRNDFGEENSFLQQKTNKVCILGEQDPKKKMAPRNQWHLSP